MNVPRRIAAARRCPMGLVGAVAAALLLGARSPAEGIAAADDEDARRPPSFVLKDGSRVTATFEETAFQVETAYGTLTVPVGDVRKVIFGKVSDPDLAGRVSALVTSLGDSDFEAREAASEALRRMGWTVEPELRDASRSEDAEVQQRAKEILGELHESEPPPEGEGRMPKEDTIVAKRFTIRGRLLLDAFAVKTSFGDLRFAKKDIAVLHVTQPKMVMKEIAVGGDATVPDGLLDTEIFVPRGSRVSIRASGTITLTNWGGRAARPEGMEGSMMNGFKTGALMARVGEEGNLFYTDREFDDTIRREGNLFLGIVSRDAGQTTGAYKVKIEVLETE